MSNSVGIAFFAQYMIVQRVTASTFGLGGQFETTILALVTTHVKATVKCHYAYSFLHSRFGHDGPFADWTLGRKPLMEVIDAMNSVGSVNSKRNAVEWFSANHASEALKEKYIITRWGKKSHLQNSQFLKKSHFQITIFTKFTFLKSNFWQNSHF